MEITEVKIFKTSEENPVVRAYASITIDDCFIVKNLRVIQGKERLFVAMPSRKKANGEHEDEAHPLNQETRDMIESKVLDAYNKAEE